MSSKPRVPSSGLFRCCSSKATKTESEAGDALEATSDPLSPIKPGDAVEAFEVQVDEVPQVSVGGKSSDEGAAATVQEEEAGSDTSVPTTPVIIDEPPADQHAHAIASEIAIELRNESTTEGDQSDWEKRDLGIAGSAFVDDAASVVSEQPVASPVEKSTPVMHIESVDVLIEPTGQDFVHETSEPDERMALLSASDSSSKKPKKRKSHDNVPLLKVPFYRKPFASTKSQIITWTTVAVCVVATVCVSLVQYTTPFPVVEVGPDGEALAASEVNDLSNELAEVSLKTHSKHSTHGKTSHSTHNDAPRVTHKAASDDLDVKTAKGSDAKKSHSDSSSKHSSKLSLKKSDAGSKSLKSSKSSKNSNQKSSVGSTDRSGSTTHHSSGNTQHSSGKKTSASASSHSSHAKSKSAKSRAKLGDVDDEVIEMQTAATCVSRHTESTHGMLRQSNRLCGDSELWGDAGKVKGCVGSPSDECQKCYLTGTPGETQSSSMDMCRADVCLEYKVVGCAPAESDEGDEGDEVTDEGDEEYPPEAALGGRDGSEFGRDGLRSSGAVVYENSGHKAARRLGPEIVTNRVMEKDTARTVGRCVADSGDANIGRFTWEDKTCGESGGSTLGCFSKHSTHCRFCVVDGRESLDDSLETTGDGGTFGRCPKDVCDVHNLRWALCDDR